MRYEIRIGGMGGQGAITAGRILGEAASLYDRKHVTMTEDYSPYITGGWSRADLVVSDQPIAYPLVSRADALMALSQDALETHWEVTKPKGLILVEESIVDASRIKGRKVISVPALEAAEKLGKRVVANVVMLGSLTAATKAVSEGAVKKALTTRFPRAVELNMAALERGALLARSEE